MLSKVLYSCLLAAMLPLVASAQSFSASGLEGESLSNPTSLQFGPDGRLYVSQQNGDIFAYTVVRDSANAYRVTATETIPHVRMIQNHNDDGTVYTGNVRRQVTGILVVGTPETPILYATSSDYRIGGGGSGSDQNLDTNSGMISRLTKTNDGWSKVDLVRGLPRSEQNHATNGLDIVGDVLYVAQGGHTNAGSPSNNFAFQTEYALSASILKVDLAQLDALPVLTDASSGSSYIYDLPTLDDPTRPNVDGHDVGDPFGGNDGLNQAKLPTSGPVTVHARGFRNHYDILVTRAGHMYTWDNGSNASWGGHPENEGTANVTNRWLVGEPGSTFPSENEGVPSNRDNLHLVAPTNYYGGHPNPIRANPAGAGLFTNNLPGGENGVFRTDVTSDPATTLPVDWPPVPLDQANPIEGDFQYPGVADPSIYWLPSSTNGITEYTASNFDGELSGHLLAASFNGKLYRAKLNADGGLDSPDDVVVLAENFGSQPLDVTAISDDGPFPGTVWAATYGANNISVFEPADYETEIVACSGDDLPDTDEDQDGYTNADEIDNGTDPCSGASQPADFDGTLIAGFKVSDLNDPDDDDDGLADNVDPFPHDAENGLTTQLPIDYPFLNGDPGFGFFGLGFTGLMTDGTTDYLQLINDEDNSTTEIIAGGAVGLFTQNGVPVGSPAGAENGQRNGYQFGIATDAQTDAFAIEVMLLGPVFPNALTGAGRQSAGFYLGDGGQDNFLEINVSRDATGAYISVLQEDEVSGSNVNDFPAGGAELASQLRLLLYVDPATGSVRAGYGVGAADPVLLPGTYQLAGPILTALQSSGQAMAVGVSARNASGQPAYNVTYDYLRIQAEATPNPVVTSTLVGADAALVDGAEVLTFSNLEGNTPIIVTSIAVNGPATFSYLTYANLPDTLQVGESMDIEATYGGVGGQTGELVIGHNGANGPELSVVLNSPDLPVPTELYVNAGGPAVTIDGRAWEDDQHFVTGNSYTNTVEIASTDADALYQSERWSGSLAYAVPVTNGKYILDLHFADIYSGTQGDGLRVFGINLEGETVLSPLDIFEEAGGYTALVKTFEVTVNDGELNIDFVKIIENPKLSAYSIRPDESCLVGTPCDDGDDCTVDDVIMADCGCAGVLPPPVPQEPVVCGELYLNCAGPELTIGDVVWQDDRAYARGNIFRTLGSVTGTDVEGPYLTGRSHPELNYAIPVENGNYQLVLHFAEITGGNHAAGDRVFGVQVEGTEVIPALDIFAKVGGFVPYVRTFDVTITDGELNIGTTRITGDPKFSAIELRRICIPVDPCYRDLAGE